MTTLLILLHKPRPTPFPLSSICNEPPPPTSHMTNNPFSYHHLRKEERGRGSFVYNYATMIPLFDLGYERTGYARGTFSPTATLWTFKGVFCLESRFIEDVSSYVCVSVNNYGKILNTSENGLIWYLIYFHNALQKPFTFEKHLCFDK